MKPKLTYAILGVVTGCSAFSDGAVDLATCIRKGADDMSSRSAATSEVTCPVHSKRTVTVILTPPNRGMSETDVSALRELGVPADAIYYSGPDTPSLGQRVGLGSVNVYDPHFTDNRKYAITSALGPRTRVAGLMAKTGDRFQVILKRHADGTVEVVALR